MKTVIYLVRHGEVENPGKIIYGRLPGYKLSKRGKLQVNKLSEFFKDIGIDALFSSPLLRSRQTARSILTHHPDLKINYSRSFLETNNKIWEGINWMRLDNNLANLFKNTPTKINVPGLESTKSIEKRVSKKIDWIIKKYEGKNVIIVSHADPIRVATLHYQKKPLDQLHESICANASITTLVFDGKILVKSDYTETHPCADESYWIKTKKELV